MGKPADPHLRLRCVHCSSTETPLWRAGPDGPKTLCNACGVRYKKGKLVLYKDAQGNLTAVKRDDANPVHVPPAPKKVPKKVVAASPPAQQSQNGGKVVKKVPSEGTIATTAVAKKVKARSRRNNAGQLPGRYINRNANEGAAAQWRSPVSSPRSSPSSPAESPKFDGRLLVSLRPNFLIFHIFMRAITVVGHALSVADVLRNPSLPRTAWPWSRVANQRNQLHHWVGFRRMFWVTEQSRRVQDG